MDDNEIIRIAVRASLAAVATVVACIIALFLVAAAVSPDVNIPGINVTNSARSGD